MWGSESDEWEFSNITNQCQEVIGQMNYLALRLPFIQSLSVHEWGHQLFLGPEGIASQTESFIERPVGSNFQLYHAYLYDNSAIVHRCSEQVMLTCNTIHFVKYTCTWYGRTFLSFVYVRMKTWKTRIKKKGWVTHLVLLWPNSYLIRTTRV